MERTSSIGDFSLSDVTKFKTDDSYGLKGYLSFAGENFVRFVDYRDGEGVKVEGKLDPNGYRQNLILEAVLDTLCDIVYEYKGSNTVSKELLEFLETTDLSATARKSLELLIMMLFDLHSIAKYDKEVYMKVGDSRYYYLAVCNYNTFIEPIKGVHQEVGYLVEAFQALNYDEALSYSEKSSKGRRGSNAIVGLFVGKGQMDWNLTTKEYASLLSV